MNKQQVVTVHGGDTFKSYEEYWEDLSSLEMSLERLRHRDWKNGLQNTLGEAYEVISPRFPNSNNACFAEWEIYFDKILPLLEDNVILIGHSLGGVFLAKYLSKNSSPKKIKATMLVAAPYDDESHYSLTDFKIEADLTKLAQQGGRLFIYQSEDDFIVPASEARKYQKALPNAAVRMFSDRNHFLGPDFPEIVDDIRSLT